jgi:hypothetical protein
MTLRSRLATLLSASALVLSGCFGSSDDKGDTAAPILTPKPSTVQDANTAGSSKTILPEIEKNDLKAPSPTGDAPK